MTNEINDEGNSNETVLSRHLAEERLLENVEQHVSWIHSMNPAKSRIVTRDIEGGGDPRLRSHSREPRLAVAINEEYGRYGRT